MTDFLFRYVHYAWIFVFGIIYFIYLCEACLLHTLVRYYRCLKNVVKFDLNLLQYRNLTAMTCCFLSKLKAKNECVKKSLMKMLTTHLL